jgi:uncharacterized protein DUF6941
VRVDFVVLADYATLTADGKLMISGIFHEIGAAAIPTQHTCHIVTSVAGGRTELGPHRLDLRLTHEDGAEHLNFGSDFELPEPKAHRTWAGCGINLRCNLPVPKLGHYRLTARVDGVELGGSLLYVWDARTEAPDAEAESP